MDTRELQGLLEAYNQIHAPQEVDEAVKGASPHTMQMRKDAAAERRAGIKPLPAKKGEEYAKYKMSQMAYSKRKREMDEEVEQVDEATAMAKRGLDEPAIRQKIAKSTGGGEAADRATKLADRPTFGNANKAQQRQNLARAQRSDFRKTTSSSPGLHGYGHKSDDPAVKAKQAARGAQRGALTPVEKKQLNREEFDIFDIVLEFLQAEGYAETLEEAKWMMANVIDEEAIDIILGEEQLDEISQKTATRAYAARATGEYEYDTNPSDQTKSGKYKSDVARERIKKKFGDKAAQHADRAAHAGIFGRKSFSMPKKPTNEEYVDEAQVANRDPDKYEREQAKKSAPVRGERTPMPPRGDKRREDFEKWYRANVR